MLSLLSISGGLLLTVSPLVAGMMLLHTLRGHLKPWWLWIPTICSSLLLVASYFQGQMQHKSFTLSTLFFVGGTILPLAIGTGLYIHTRDVPHRMLAGWMLGAVFPVILISNLYIGAATSWTYPFEPEARRLIGTLSRYYQQHGTYPEQIEVLVENGNRVNDVPIGCMYRFYTKKEEYYFLSYQQCTTTEPFSTVDCTYSSHTKQWMCSDVVNIAGSIQKSNPTIRELRTTLEDFRQ